MVAEYLGYCMPKTNETYPVYKSFSPRIPELHTLYPLVSHFIKGGTCGFSSIGLLTHYSVVLTVLSDFIAYHEPNDGLVPQSSCVRQPLNVYAKRPDAQFYLAYANHADETCRNGNGLGADRKPCAFYTDKEWRAPLTSFSFISNTLPGNTWRVSPIALVKNKYCFMKKILILQHKRCTNIQIHIG